MPIPSDEPVHGVGNTVTKSRSEYGFRLAQDDAALRPQFDGVDGVDLGLDGALLHAGDLIEVSSGAWTLRILAICLGNFNGHLHFYTNTGKWFTTRTIRPGFVIRKFIDDPGELDAVVGALPSLSPSSIVLDQLQDLNIGPSRDVASPLIHKMVKFQADARAIHQTYVERLSRAHLQLGSHEKMLSLREIADTLLPSNLKRANKGSFSPEALYAVFSVIEEDPIGFRVLNRGARQNESYLYVLRSANLQENVHRVKELVRDYSESTGRSRGPTPGTPAAALDTFLAQARRVIDQAREIRDYSPHGMVGPCKKTGSEHAELNIPAWSGPGLAVIRYLESWATAGFSSSFRYHWVGAAVLRALGRYDDALLDSTTAWTFLQEIGWLPPWDVSARHSLRLPGVQRDHHAGLLPSLTTASSSTQLGPDRLADLRQDFARSTVYCIDSADTLDVDDGISLEPAADGEYWIHTHVADPASRIDPESPIAQKAAARAQTSYLSGFGQRMFDADNIRDAFSLGANQPTLTFSARVNEAGEVLEGKITPGLLRDVVYITPEDVASVVGHDNTSSVPPDVLEVGTPPKSSPARRMIKPDELSRSQRNELQTLARLAAAHQQRRLAKGAFPTFMPKVKADVSYEGISAAVTSGDSVLYNGDPFIRVHYEGRGEPLVSSLMQLAGEVGARWCFERNIAIPYRVQVLAAQNEKALREFLRDVFNPQLVAGKRPETEDWATLRALSGGFDISTHPAPNYVMGLDLYTKVTSPLRRYPDMLVHWQIEAALLEEHRRGTSLVVREFPTNTDDLKLPFKTVDRDFLPFSKRQLEEQVFPQLRIRERYVRLTDNSDGNEQWVLQALVRAWRYGEGGPDALPKTFRFTARDVVGRSLVSGSLDWFEMQGTLRLVDMHEQIRIAEVKPGDVFDVEIADVNVYEQKIYVKLLEKAEEGEAETEKVEKVEA
ncbi:3'-5' RNA exonuclease complex component [Collariella sp. IMI 366227]|nr:3'-5' RNA exonuclease complex component [Collariella sp. IMI 366227]